MPNTSCQTSKAGRGTLTLENSHQDTIETKHEYTENNKTEITNTLLLLS